MLTKSLTIEESVAAMINYEFYFGDVPLDEMLETFVAHAKQKNTTEPELTEDIDLYAERINVNSLRLALAHSLRSSLEMEIDRINSGYESKIELDHNDGLVKRFRSLGQ